MDAPCTIGESKCNRDALFEILMRVDHDDIYNCILVSKDWLSVIINPIFKSHYVWKKSNPIVVESLRYESYILSGSHFTETSNLGRNIKVRNVMSNNIGSFICQSPKGDMLLFGRVIQEDSSIRLYVCKSATESIHVQLPESEVYYINGSYANIIPSLDGDDDEYRVILASNHNNNCIYQVYCSRMGKWDTFIRIGKWETLIDNIIYSRFINLKPNEVKGKVEGGLVSSGASVIYWKALMNGYDHCLAAFDVNGGDFKFITKPPPFEKDKRNNKKIGFNVTYGTTKESLLALMCDYQIFCSDWQSKWCGIQLWVLDDYSDGQCWCLLFKVRQSQIWTKNLTLLNSLFKGRAQKSGGYVFVSFIPEEHDSILVALEERAFIYHFGTQKLEYVKYLKYVGHSIKNLDDGLTHQPLTMLDLGDNWPSCPFSLRRSLFLEV